MAPFRADCEDGGQQANSKDPPPASYVINMEDEYLDSPVRFSDQRKDLDDSRPTFTLDNPTQKDKRQSGASNRSRRVVLEVPVKLKKRVSNFDGIKSVAQETEQYVNITAMHGVRRLWEANGWSKLFWGLVVILCAGLLIWELRSSIISYTDEPTVSQVSFLMAEQGLDFPKVTICNYNAIRKTYLQKLNETGNISTRLSSYLISSNNDVLAVYGNRPKAEIEQDDVEYQVFKQNNPHRTLRTFFEQGGFECSDILKMCSFAGRQFNCCDYARPVLTSLGKCQVLNMQATPYEWMKKQTEGSESAGLQIVLDAQIDQQTEGIADPDPLRNTVLPSGFKYYIDEPATWTYASSQGISVSPGEIIYSGLSASKFTLLDRNSWGNCTSIWPAGYSGNNTMLKYQEKDCISKCKAKFFFEKCGCSPFVYNIDEEYSMCSPLETYNCVEKYIVKNHNEKQEEFIWPECEECAPECERWKYDSSNSYGRGLSEADVTTMMRMNTKLTDKSIQSYLLSVNIFFKDTTYTEYSQVAATSLTATLSNMGGLMGLFLGMSVLTIIETIILILKICWLTVCRSRRKYEASKRRTKLHEEKQAKNIIQTLSAAALVDMRDPGSIKKRMTSSTSLDMSVEDEEYELRIPVKPSIKRGLLRNSSRRSKRSVKKRWLPSFLRPKNEVST